MWFLAAICFTATIWFEPLNVQSQLLFWLLALYMCITKKQGQLFPRKSKKNVFAIFSINTSQVHSYRYWIITHGNISDDVLNASHWCYCLFNFGTITPSSADCTVGNMFTTAWKHKLCIPSWYRALGMPKVCKVCKVAGNFGNFLLLPEASAQYFCSSKWNHGPMTCLVHLAPVVVRIFKCISLDNEIIHCVARHKIQIPNWMFWN